MRKSAQNNFMATAAIMVVASFAAVVQSNPASAKSVLGCEGKSRQSVVECCRTVVNESGLPFWMRQAGLSCASAEVFVCRGGSSRSRNTASTAPGTSLRCKVRIVDIPSRGSDNPPGGGTPPGGGGGTPSTAPR